ncbi:uncharacterized protein BO80DRAFT_193215 [Aspergillus ibericus CBS 121593]|uniref:Uncharacterized protein n=1 Tax=Aspergillus ibericus CBS 121593 TaxID=1448316 RepID=A0A395GPZ5_9EURO|nr:hypothetical protein BO80DRAFT_193215 [Aspergillus ibericus CBS 121593]RAK97444.1 hypothetical protein BO80DRAFT_193215 [Aspergillus ibericus CBS 121593]
MNGRGPYGHGRSEGHIARSPFRQFRNPDRVVSGQPANGRPCATYPSSFPVPPPALPSSGLSFHATQRRALSWSFPWAWPRDGASGKIGLARRHSSSLFPSGWGSRNGCTLANDAREEIFAFSKQVATADSMGGWGNLLAHGGVSGPFLRFSVRRHGRFLFPRKRGNSSTGDLDQHNGREEVPRNHTIAVRRSGGVDAQVLS